MCPLELRQCKCKKAVPFQHHLQRWIRRCGCLSHDDSSMEALLLYFPPFSSLLQSHVRGGGTC